jgi:hypothetical protein
MAKIPEHTDRREFLRKMAAASMLPPAACSLGIGIFGALGQRSAQGAGQDLRQDWLRRWEKSILNDARNRYCDREMGEEIGWLISPFLSGFYYGYLATHDGKWVTLLVDWADAWIKRGVKEPDGYAGWPKADGASTSVMSGLYTDNLLGEAMGLRPVVLMADTVLKTPALREKYGRKAEEYIKLAEQIFEKWRQRGCWREVTPGGLWVVPPFGIDRQTDRWTEGYQRRSTDGFSLPANKQNFVALWLLAMHEVTKNPRYRELAEKWWRLMKSRMRLRERGKFFVWNYWDPAGPWDYKPDGSTKHWVGVHPNGGYYAIDVEGIVAAYEQGLVFGQEDLKRLVATNRDFMWNQQIKGAKFRRIDGGKPDSRWQNMPGVLWTALGPHDDSLRKVFEANHKPDSWGGLATTPWYFAPRSRQPARSS